MLGPGTAGVAAAACDGCGDCCVENDDDVVDCGVGLCGVEAGAGACGTLDTDAWLLAPKFASFACGIFLEANEEEEDDEC